MAVRDDTDVVVVGAGAGGLAAAWRLTTQGLDVVLLEDGIRYDPARDYPQTKDRFDDRGFPYNAGVDANGRRRYTFGDRQSIEPAWTDYCSKPFRNGQPPTQRVYHQYSHVRGIGGSSLHFQGEAHRYHPDAFRMRSQYAAGYDWPITFDELEPYYDLAEDRIGVAAPVVNVYRPRNRPPTLPAHNLSYASNRLSHAFRAANLDLLPNSLAVLSRAYRGRPPCNYCNSCTEGCPLGDKGSADVTFFPDALATRRLNVRTQSQAVQIETAHGRAVSVVYATKDGSRNRVHARFVVLAAGAIETPRLLLMSDPASARNGLGNGSGCVGRNLTETLFWAGSGFHPERVDSFKGLPMDGSAWNFAVPVSDGRPYTGCFRVATAHGTVGLRGPASLARTLPGFGVMHQREVYKRFGHLIAIAAIGEWLPNDGTYVTLDPKVMDSNGMPVACIHSALGLSERTLLKRMVDSGRAVLASAGVTDVSERSAMDSFDATHVLGTCRMGSNPQKSVCDSQGFSHEIPNLAFADASMVPSSGWGDSPFLTITALALRTADGICLRAKLT